MHSDSTLSHAAYRKMRLLGFIRKECLQIMRDPSSLLLGIVMPVLMLIIFGYGVSLDPKNVPVALLLEDNSSATTTLFAKFSQSEFYRPIPVATARTGTHLLSTGAVDAMVRIRPNFSSEAAHGLGEIQLIVNSVDANRARLVEGYILQTIQLWLQQIASEQGSSDGAGIPPVSIDSRIWFNAAPESTYSLVPGLLTLIMTLIGTLLTALVIAREWERGTMEALLSTPIQRIEILLGKLIPYFVLGMTGMGLAVLLSVFLFSVPLRGSVIALFLAGALFLSASLGVGLLISTIVRVQFLAAMIAVISGFLPAFFLSGLLFDLQSTPLLIQAFSIIIPAKYFVLISQTLFLAGNVWEVIVPAGSILCCMAILLLIVTWKKLHQRLPQ
ncbi:MAG: ABC transporter permease [Desulfovibrionales bacterium]|nr:ABC transporter permease [Desulfovibrionales bacterium]